MRQQSKYPTAILLKMAVHAAFLMIILTDKNADDIYMSLRSFKRDCRKAPLN